LITTSWVIYIALKSNPKSWQDRESRKTRTKNLVNAYVGQALSSQGFDYNKLGNIYRPDQQQPSVTVKRVLKQEFIRDMIEKKLKEIMEEKTKRDYGRERYQQILGS